MKLTDQKILKKLLESINKDSYILDVGCGIGDNLSFLSSLGYKNAIGTDINFEMVQICLKRLLSAMPVSEISKQKDKFDVLLISHVIEHLEYRDFQSFFELYLSKLKVGGSIIILTPVLYSGFYNDIDHIKPYYPDGIVNLFSSNQRSKQYNSQYEIELRNLIFRKDSLCPYFLKGRFITNKLDCHRVFYLLIRKIYDFFFKISYGLIGQTTGYGALFKLIANKKEDIG